jgi:response regulator RpfG family c-di-GMP phosphodiesterase
LTLEFAEYQVSTAVNGEEALRVVAEQRIDGIVLGYDVDAPDGRSMRNLLRHLIPICRYSCFRMSTKFEIFRYMFFAHILNIQVRRTRY